MVGRSTSGRLLKDKSSTKRPRIAGYHKFTMPALEAPECERLSRGATISPSHSSRAPSRKDVYQIVAVIGQDPFGGVEPLDALWILAFFTQLEANLFTDGLNLARIASLNTK